MKITILGRDYQIEIAAKPIMVDGLPAKAAISTSRRRITLSPTLPRTERMREVIHEARHAWTDDRGVPNDAEFDARDVAAFSDVILEQIEQQGGRNALMNLEPASERRRAERGDAILAPAGYDCARCNATTMAGSVETSAVHRGVVTLCCWVDRSFRCEVCGAFNSWTERATLDGLPTGVPMPGRKYQCV